MRFQGDRGRRSATVGRASLRALVLGASPVARLGISALIRAEFGDAARVLGVGWGARRSALAAVAAPFDLVVVCARAGMRGEDLAHAAALAGTRGTVLVALERDAAPVPVRAPAAVRWIALEAPPEEWRRAVRGAGVAAVRAWRHARATATMRGEEAPASASHSALAPLRAPGHLTPRQREVFDLLCAGLPNKIIAERLGLSVGTVKLHVGAILRALNAHRRLDIVVRRMESARLHGRAPGPDEAAWLRDATGGRSEPRD